MSLHKWRQNVFHRLMRIYVIGSRMGPIILVQFFFKYLGYFSNCQEMLSVAAYYQQSRM
jgi:hypothetical protein